MVSTWVLLLPHKERLTTTKQKRGLSPSTREVSQVTKPRDRRSGAYVTAQIVAICRTSELSSIDFTTAAKLPATFELDAVYFQNITNVV